jgi:hypothetical protein
LGAADPAQIGVSTGSRTGPQDLAPLKGWMRSAAGVLVVVVAVVVFALIPGSKRRTLSPSQRQFGPICASSGHLDSVARVGRTNQATIYRVHCSGGLTTEVAR